MHLVLFGAGELEDVLDRDKLDLYCMDNVHIMGHQSFETLARFHSIARVSVLSRVPGSGVIRGRGSGERETTASSLAGKEESSRKEENSGQGKDGPAGAIEQGGNGR